MVHFTESDRISAIYGQKCTLRATKLSAISKLSKRYALFGAHSKAMPVAVSCMAFRFNFIQLFFLVRISFTFNFTTFNKCCNSVFVFSQLTKKKQRGKTKLIRLRNHLRITDRFLSFHCDPCEFWVVIKRVNLIKIHNTLSMAAVQMQFPCRKHRKFALTLCKCFK